MVLPLGKLLCPADTSMPQVQQFGLCAATSGMLAKPAKQICGICCSLVQDLTSVLQTSDYDGRSFGLLVKHLIDVWFTLLNTAIHHCCHASLLFCQQTLKVFSMYYTASKGYTQSGNLAVKPELPSNGAMPQASCHNASQKSCHRHYIC